MIRNTIFALVSISKRRKISFFRWAEINIRKILIVIVSHSLLIERWISSRFCVSDNFTICHLLLFRTVQKYHFFDYEKFNLQCWKMAMTSFKWHLLLIEIGIFFHKYFNWHLFIFRTVEHIIFRGGEKTSCFSKEILAFVTKILFSSKLWYFQSFSI